MRPWARTIWEAAMSSIAFVIFCVDLMLRILRRRTRPCPPATSVVPAGVERLGERLHGLLEGVALGQRARRPDVLQQLGVVGPEVSTDLGFVSLHVVDGHMVGVAVGAGEDHEHLLLDRDRSVDPLLQQFGEAVAAVELAWDTLSSSEPKVARASSSRNLARSSFNVPENDPMALI